MSNRVYNTDKVENKIGLPGVVKYDKIDVFVDQTNKNNVWGIVYYTEYYKNKPIVKEKIVAFTDFNDMIRFVKSNFDSYEMNHRVDYSERHIFFHNVDYLGIDYYMHEGKPNLNYIELKYKEYINGDYQSRKRRFTKEYEKMFLHIVKVNKKLVENTTTNNLVVNTIDVYAKPSKKLLQENSLKENLGIINQERNRRRRVSQVTKNKNQRIKNLRILISTVALGTILVGGGYKIVKDISTYKREFIVQNRPAITATDIDIYLHKSRANDIIANLMDNNYEDVSSEDLNYILEFIHKVENSNYDRNNSTTMFNYTEYFSSKIYESNQNIIWEVNSDNVLSKIEKLYNDSFTFENNKLTIKKDNLKKYIDYVASLTFMYDTIVDNRGSDEVPMDTQSIFSIYANKVEIEAYNKFPLILKYTILNQLKAVLQHVEYQVTTRPSYYFKDLDKSSLINEVTSIMENTAESLKYYCREKDK